MQLRNAMHIDEKKVGCCQEERFIACFLDPRTYVHRI
jgi:hypothetical protein